jgi:hypothetical protein
MHGSVVDAAVCDHAVAEAVRVFGGLLLALHAAGVMDDGDVAQPLDLHGQRHLLPDPITLVDHRPFLGLRESVERGRGDHPDSPFEKHEAAHGFRSTTPHSHRLKAGRHRPLPSFCKRLQLSADASNLTGGVVRTDGGWTAT